MTSANWFYRCMANVYFGRRPVSDLNVFQEWGYVRAHSLHGMLRWLYPPNAIGLRRYELEFTKARIAVPTHCSRL